MPFVTVRKGIHGRAATAHGVAVVRMGCGLATGTQKPREVGISVSKQAIIDAGFTDFSSEPTRCRMQVDEGWGDDAGFLLLTPRPSSETQHRACSSASDNWTTTQISIPVIMLKHYVLNECPVPQADVQFTIDGNSILVQCPDWLRYNSQSLSPQQIDQLNSINAVKQEAARETPQRPPERTDTKVKDDKDNITHLNRQDRRRIASAVARRLAK